MEVDGASKKRKICAEEDQEDEAKMETFFALVRSMRDTRDRWINFRSGDSRSYKSKEEHRDNIIPVWKPKFQVEDFAEEEAIKCPNPDASNVDLVAGASKSNNCAGKQEVEEKGIDLSLSL